MRKTYVRHKPKSFYVNRWIFTYRSIHSHIPYHVATPSENWHSRSHKPAKYILRKALYTILTAVEQLQIHTGSDDEGI